MGSDTATASSVTVNSATSLTAKIKIPGGAPAGQYSLRVSDSTTGNILDSLSFAFNVVAVPPPASITVYPDTGAASTTFEVTITGQYTNFQPTSQVSGYINIDLKSGMTSIWHTHPDSVLSATSMTASLSLLDSLPAGTYDLEVSSLSSQPPYDYHTPFYVIPFSIILPERNSGQPLSIVPVKVHAGGAHFIDNNGGTMLDVTDVQLIHGQTSIPGQNITVASDTSLSADFMIPADAPMGSYSLRIVEPGTGRIILSNGAFTVEANAGVEDPGNPVADLTSFTVSPNPSGGHVFLKFSLARPENVRLTMTDALGRVVTTLSNGMLQPGSKSFEWANDDAATGSYFYELVAGKTMLVGRVIVQR